MCLIYIAVLQYFLLDIIKRHRGESMDNQAYKENYMCLLYLFRIITKYNKMQ